MRVFKNLSLFIGLLLFGIILAGESLGNAQTLYSYRDENGIRIFTNIPPTNYGNGITVSGADPSSAGATDKLPAKTKASIFDPIIAKYAGQYRVDPDLVKSIIAAESGFDPKAVSPKGAMGLMQLMPATAARLGVKNAFNPEENIMGGIKHLRMLLDTFDNDLVLSLAAYNAGENLVQRIGRVPNYRETHDYVRTVTERFGSRQMTDLPETVPSIPTTYRYFDQNGVLHISNIPPVDRSFLSQGPKYGSPASPH